MALRTPSTGCEDGRRGAKSVWAARACRRKPAHRWPPLPPRPARPAASRDPAQEACPPAAPGGLPAASSPGRPARRQQPREAWPASSPGGLPAACRPRPGPAPPLASPRPAPPLAPGRPRRSPRPGPAARPGPAPPLAPRPLHPPRRTAYPIAATAHPLVAPRAPSLGCAVGRWGARSVVGVSGRSLGCAVGPRGAGTVEGARSGAGRRRVERGQRRGGTGRRAPSVNVVGRRSARQPVIRFSASAHDLVISSSGSSICSRTASCCS